MQGLSLSTIVQLLSSHSLKDRHRAPKGWGRTSSVSSLTMGSPCPVHPWHTSVHIRNTERQHHSSTAQLWGRYVWVQAPTGADSRHQEKESSHSAFLPWGLRDIDKKLLVPLNWCAAESLLACWLCRMKAAQRRKVLLKVLATGKKIVHCTLELHHPLTQEAQESLKTTLQSPVQKAAALCNTGLQNKHKHANRPFIQKQ